MTGGLISTRYAKALLEFAEMSKETETVYEEALQYVGVYQKNKRIRTILANPILARTEKRKLILAVFGEKTTGTMLRFMDLVLQKEREIYLFSIFLKYIDLYREKYNIFHTRLFTASEIDKRTEDRIVNLVREKTGGKIELEKIVASEVLGGFILEVNSNRWDASIASQLRDIKQEFADRNMKSL